MDLHHEVSSRHKLSNEAGVAGRLEAGKEGQQEGVPCATHSLQDPLLTVQAARENMKWNLHGLCPDIHPTPLAEWVLKAPRWQVDGSQTGKASKLQNYHDRTYR